MSTRLEGRAAAPGAGLGPAFIVSPPEEPDDLPESRHGSVEDEQARLADALTRAEEELRELASRVADAAGQDEADIFDAHAEFAADPELRSMAEAAIEDGASPEKAIHDAFGTFREMLSQSSSEYLAARAEDLDDVRDRVVKILLGVDTRVAAPDDVSVIVAATLSPSQTASIPRELIAGIVTATGSPTSHAAILARSLGVPAVVACDGLMDVVESGVVVGVDGRDGEVLIDPSLGEIKSIEERIEQEQQRRDELAQLRDQPGQTADGHRVELAANIGSVEDLPVAIDAGAEGSGLVRTEFLFMGRQQPPGVKDQVDFYTEVLRAFPGHRVVFRTMDIGADKPLPFVDRDPEENPALGLRGIRLHLTRPELLRDQVRALLQAGAAVADEDAGTLAIMFPLVSVLRELTETRALLEEVATEERVDLHDIEIGIMIEVPSAALVAEKLAHHVDFFSIGTNDLLQYLFAADRLNAALPELQDVCDPGVLGLLEDVIEAGHDADAWVGVCGEAASDPAVASALVGLGIDELSMTPIAIPEVKDVLQRLDRSDCQQAVQTAIAEAADGTQARHLIEQRLEL